MKDTANQDPSATLDLSSRFARNDAIDLEELRARLRKMTDEDLLRVGKAARFMCRDACATGPLGSSISAVFRGSQFASSPTERSTLCERR